MNSESSAQPILQVRNLSVGFSTQSGTLSALDGVTFDVPQGSIMGVVGESGCGKSVLAKTVLGLLPQRGVSRRGSVLFRGVDLLQLTERALEEIRGDAISLVFQDPSAALNPYIRVGRQITETLHLHRNVARPAGRAAAVALLESLGISDPAKRMRWYPHQFSGGMQQRVMIASALICEPDMLIADEATTGLDPIVELQLMGLLSREQEARSFTLMLISHDLRLVGQFASTVAVMYAGRVMELGPAQAIMGEAKVPYTIGLLAAAPTLTGGGRVRLAPLEGAPPDSVNPPKGCRFAPRCPSADSHCHAEAPPLRSTSDGGQPHYYACWHPEEDHR